MTDDERRGWLAYSNKYGRLSPAVRNGLGFARVAAFLQNNLAVKGAYGKNPTFASAADFAPWLETPIDLETAMREWK